GDGPCRRPTSPLRARVGGRRPVPRDAGARCAEDARTGRSPGRPPIAVGSARTGIRRACGGSSAPHVFRAPSSGRSARDRVSGRTVPPRRLQAAAREPPPSARAAEPPATCADRPHSGAPPPRPPVLPRTVAAAMRGYGRYRPRTAPMGEIEDLSLTLTQTLVPRRRIAQDR